MKGFTRTIIEFGEEFIEPFREFIENNHGNPILWVALLGAGIGLFAFTYGALSKNN